MHFTSPNTNFLTQGGRCLEPLSRTKPLDPTRGPIGGPGPHSWVLALRTRCFSLQAIHKIRHKIVWRLFFILSLKLFTDSPLEWHFYPKITSLKTPSTSLDSFQPYSVSLHIQKDSFLHIFESFCPCTDPLWLKWVKWFTRVFLCSGTTRKLTPQNFRLKWFLKLHFGCVK